MKNKKDINKTAILEAAEKVFQKWGLGKTTMEDIAEASGRSKGSLYYYYKDKEEILNTIISGYIKDIIEKSKNATNNQTAVKEKFKVYFVTLIYEFKKYVTLFDIIRGEIKSYPALIDNTKSKFNFSITVFIKELIVEGMDNGEFRSFDKKSIDTICYSITSFMSALGEDLYLENKEFNFKQKIDLFIEILFYGLRN